MIDWQPIETFNGKDGAAYLIWDRSNGQVAVAHRNTNLRGKSWFIHDSYGFNEDGEIYASWISHWANIQEPI